MIRKQQKSLFEGINLSGAGTAVFIQGFNSLFLFYLLWYNKKKNHLEIDTENNNGKETTVGQGHRHAGQSVPQ